MGRTKTDWNFKNLDPKPDSHRTYRRAKYGSVDRELVLAGWLIEYSQAMAASESDVKLAAVLKLMGWTIEDLRKDAAARIPILELADAAARGEFGVFERLAKAVKARALYPGAHDFEDWLTGWIIDYHLSHARASGGAFNVGRFLRYLSDEFADRLDRKTVLKRVRMLGLRTFSRGAPQKRGLNKPGN